MVCSILSAIVLVLSLPILIPFYILKMAVMGLIGFLAVLVGCNWPKSWPYEIRKKDKE